MRSFNTLACFCGQLLKLSRFNRLGLAAAVINGSNRPLRHFDAMEATETSADQAEPALQSTLSTQKSRNRGADRQTRRGVAELAVGNGAGRAWAVVAFPFDESAGANANAERRRLPLTNGVVYVREDIR